MRVRIEGIVYNTETARAVGSREDVVNVWPDDSYTETLYRRKNGKFFLLINGSALVKGLEHPVKIYVDGEDILPLSDLHARMWMEDHGQGKLLERYFPEDYEGGSHE